MYPILFTIGQFSLYTHGVLAVLGILIGSLLVYRLAKYKGYNTEFLFDNIVYSVLAGIIGARITYFVLYHEQFQSLKEIFYLWDGGLVSYGGFIVGGAVFALLIKAQKENILKWLDIYAVAFAAGLFFGRIGNLMAGEYSGIRTFSKLSLNHQIPVPAYECLALILILVTLFVTMKKKFKTDGTLFYTMITMYGGLRFIIDFWRDDSKILGPISFGQIISLAIFIIGAIYLWTKILGHKIRRSK
ncbi:MAG: prolipoprotein diacylglyceryl transferase [Patescibacteria group bacterium]|jgi:phosphatidylglycerol:prolipoprotein diacylglycerol transferase